MSKIRVLHVHGGMGGGGVETFIQTMGFALQHSCASSLFSLGPACSYEGPCLPTRDADRSRVGIPIRLMRFLNHVRRWQPDVIHAHYGADAIGYGALGELAARHRIRLIAHWHSLSPTKSWKSRGRLLAGYALKRADAVLACSRAAAEAHSAAHSIAPGRVRVLYNGVDTSLFAQSPADEVFRRRVGVEHDELLAVLLGRLDSSAKGLDILCEAMRSLPEELPLHVALVGPGDLSRLRDRLDPPDNVTLFGPVERAEVPGVLRACDILLQPSRREGFGIAVIEGMAAGLPVVASRVGGMEETVEHGRTGLLVSPDDPQALAEAIRWMIEHPKERREMGFQGQQRAKLFDVNTIAAQLEEIYHEVLGD